MILQPDHCPRHSQPLEFLVKGQHRRNYTHLTLKFRNLKNLVAFAEQHTNPAEITSCFEFERAVRPRSSRYVVELGVVASCPNQTGGRRSRPVPRREHVFPTVHQKSETALRLRRARCGRARQQPNWLIEPTSANAPRNSGSQASANHPSMPSWSSCKRYDRASGHNELTPRGVRYSSQGSLRKGRKHFGADDLSLAALGARLARFQSALAPVMAADTTIAPDLTDPSVAMVVNFSSGGGLGNHQPGSHTSGGFFIATARSGRARDRAKYPAVARFIFAGWSSPVARKAHNLQAVSSNLTPATISRRAA
jgi:hypothetical protein